MNSPQHAGPELECAYALPNCHHSSDDLERVMHRDLAELTSAELMMEKVRVIHVLGSGFYEKAQVPLPTPALFMSAESWLLERLEAVDAEIVAKRRAS